jgi:hypothetical protein
MPKVPLLILLLLIFNTRPAAAQGLADWQHQTPGGNTMGDSGNGTFLRLQDQPAAVFAIRKWYFYKKPSLVKPMMVFLWPTKAAALSSAFNPPLPGSSI